jgi:vacuolar protein sorting-associated protein 16
VLLSVDSTIYVVDNLEKIDQRISRGPFTHLAASPNGKSLALLSHSGLLWVVSTDFQRSLAEFNTNEVAGVDGPIRQVRWCANDAVIVSWEGLVLLVGPFGDTLQSASFATFLLNDSTIIGFSVPALPMLSRS